MALSTWWSCAVTKPAAAQARQWYAHVAGISPLWFRLTFPWALTSAWLGEGGWGDLVLPFLVSPVFTALYAMGYIVLRRRPPVRLHYLKWIDTGVLASAAVGTWAVTGSPVACLGLFVSAWLHSWHHEASPRGPGEGEIPQAPPLVRPVTGPVTAGYRSYDLSHTGVDIGVPEGTPVCAPADGVVVQAGPLEHWGYAVTVDHGCGWSTFFAHLSGVAVRRGERVAAGTCLSWSGSSGVSTGPHVHLELRYNGAAVDPAVLVK